MMINKTFLENQSDVSELFKRLELTEDLNIYVDSTTNQLWEKYNFELDYVVFSGLRKYPYPDLETVIGVILNSENLDEVSAACGYFYEREFSDRLEFREELIDAIERCIHTIDSERFEIIFRRAELYSPMNKRDVLGKSFRQIQSDAKYFEHLANRAIGLRDLLQS